MNPDLPNERQPWRETAQRAARQAALHEMAAKGIQGPPCFAYRWEHVQAVVRTARRLAALTGADAEIVEAASWLHDVAKGRSQDHGRDGAIAAREILAQTDFPDAKVDAVADAIAKHVGLFTEERVEPLEAAVVWDADKLTKLGATAVLHFSGARIARNHAAQGSSVSTGELVRHLPAGEWQERTAHSFNTAPARAAGQRRLAAFRRFCEQAQIEFQGDDLAPQT
jgi:uncharacterized protein